MDRHIWVTIKVALHRAKVCKKIIAEYDLETKRTIPAVEENIF